MGVAASALMDVWSAVLRRRFGIPTFVVTGSQPSVSGASIRSSRASVVAQLRIVIDL
jgi:hypothetical protein